jgi:hypothetical protein
MKGKEYSMNMNKQGEMMKTDKKNTMKGMDHSMMDMSDPMSMSMADMGKMLEGKS